MYTQHFGLTQRPFSRVPSATRCVMFPGIKSCLDRSVECIGNSSGPVLAIGPSGCGKSTLLALIENHFTKQLTVVTLNCASIDSRHELIQCLLFELGLPFESPKVGELRLKLIDHLKSPEQCPNGLLLLVDEAHNLSLDVLEELRMITNLVCGSRHQIRLVISGGRSLEEKFGHPSLESFNQRVGVRCYLNPMTRSETMYFVLAQMQMCGRDGRDIFQPSALEKIFDITDGIPRLAAHLCDHTLRNAATRNREKVDSKLVQDSWLDLQQLPATPLVEDFMAGPESGIIEFGALDDSAAGPATAEDALEFSRDSDEVTNSRMHDSSIAEPGIPGPHLHSMLESETVVPEQDAVVEQLPTQTQGAIENTLDNLLDQLNQIDMSDEQEGTSDADYEMPTLTEAIKAAQSAARRDDGTLVDGNQPTTGKTPTTAATQTPGEPFEYRPDTQPVSESAEHSQIEIVSHSAEEDMPCDQSPVEFQAQTAPEAPVQQEHVATGNETHQESDCTTDTSSRSVTAEELFGESFEQEFPVLDIQTQVLANQNRVSSGITSPEIAAIHPVTSEPASTEPEIAIHSAESMGPDTQNTQQHPIAADSSGAASPERPADPQSSPSNSGPSPAGPGSNVGYPSVSSQEHIPNAHVVTPTDLPRNFSQPVDVEQESRQPAQSRPASQRDEPPTQQVGSGTEAQSWPAVQDDSDMLVVEQNPQVIMPAPAEEENETVATSQGRVIRMNYQDLFQQLRNQNPSNPS